MNLGLKQLQRVVKDTLKEEKSMKLFVEELRRNLGPGIMVSNKLKEIASAANEQLDIMEASGRNLDRNAFKVSVVLEAANSPHVQVRKLAARLLPTKFGSKLVFDPISSVRCAAAKNSPTRLVREALRKYPNDDQLDLIVKKKMLQEAGLSTPVAIEDEFDMYGDSPLGDAIKGGVQYSGDDFSDEWYERMARKICKEYGGNLEGNWEEKSATNLCSHYYVTSKIIVDRDKLLQAIYDCIEERENQVVKESHGANIMDHLSEEMLKEAFMPVLEDLEDPVADLLEANVSSSELIERVETLFKVRKAHLPPGIKKYRVSEGLRGDTLVPINGHTPSGFNPKTEKALDLYVDAWNKQQALRGEPYRLSWAPHATAIDMVGFDLQLK